MTELEQEKHFFMDYLGYPHEATLESIAKNVLGKMETMTSEVAILEK